MPQLSVFAQVLLAIAALGVLVLTWGGIKLIRRGDRQKGALMLVAALVLLANLLIWTV